MVQEKIPFDSASAEKAIADVCNQCDKKAMKKLFHYTSVEALFDIVQKDGLLFRASRYDCMNDSDEYKWLYEPLKARISKEYRMTEGEVDDLYEKFPYVISFSKENNPKLWERYGNYGKGVCLVLDAEKLMAASERNLGTELDVIMPIKYANEVNKMERLTEAVVQYRELGYGTSNQTEDFDDEIYCSAFVKNEAKWGVEEEVRYARIRENNLYFKDGEISSSEDKYGVQYYLRGDKPIPYLAVDFPLEVLSGVIVGSETDEQVFMEIKEMMIDCGFKEENVTISKIKIKK